MKKSTAEIPDVVTQLAAKVSVTLHLSVRQYTTEPAILRQCHR